MSALQDLPTPSSARTKRPATSRSDEDEDIPLSKRPKLFDDKSSAEMKRESDMQRRDLEAAQSVPIADSSLVYVGKSDIGGLGVFAKQFIPSGTRITTYEGRWIQPSFPIQKKTQLDTHVLSLSAMDALDGIRYPEAGKGVGSLVNSCRNTGRKASARFITINRVLKKSAYLRATVDIQPDTEILVNYNYV
jgi:hypothetical protein